MNRPRHEADPAHESKSGLVRHEPVVRLEARTWLSHMGSTQTYQNRSTRPSVFGFYPESNEMSWPWWWHHQARCWLMWSYFYNKRNKLKRKLAREGSTYSACTSRQRHSTHVSTWSACVGARNYFFGTSTRMQSSISSPRTMMAHEGACSVLIIQNFLMFFHFIWIWILDLLV